MSDASQPLVPPAASPPAPHQSFGVASLLSKEAKVFYAPVFNGDHLGRISDLLVVYLKKTGLDDVVFRLNLLIGMSSIFKKLMSQESKDPLLLECGVDSNYIAISLSFRLREGIPLRDVSKEPPPAPGQKRILTVLEQTVNRLQPTSDRVVVKMEPNSRKVEIICMTRLPTQAGQAPKGDAKKAEPEFYIIDTAALNPGEVHEGYVNLGDLNFASLLQEGSPPSGEKSEKNLTVTRKGDGLPEDEQEDESESEEVAEGGDQANKDAARKKKTKAQGKAGSLAPNDTSNEDGNVEGEGGHEEESEDENGEIRTEDKDEVRSAQARKRKKGQVQAEAGSTGEPNEDADVAAQDGDNVDGEGAESDDVENGPEEEEEEGGGRGFFGRLFRRGKSKRKKRKAKAAGGASQATGGVATGEAEGEDESENVLGGGRSEKLSKAKIKGSEKEADEEEFGTEGEEDAASGSRPKKVQKVTVKGGEEEADEEEEVIEEVEVGANRGSRPKKVDKVTVKGSETKEDDEEEVEEEVVEEGATPGSRIKKVRKITVKGSSGEEDEANEEEVVEEVVVGATRGSRPKIHKVVVKGSGSKQAEEESEGEESDDASAPTANGESVEGDAGNDEAITVVRDKSKKKKKSFLSRLFGGGKAEDEGANEDDEDKNDEGDPKEPKDEVLKIKGGHDDEKALKTIVELGGSEKKPNELIVKDGEKELEDDAEDVKVPEYDADAEDSMDKLLKVAGDQVKKGELNMTPQAKEWADAVFKKLMAEKVHLKEKMKNIYSTFRKQESQLRRKLALYDKLMQDKRAEIRAKEKQIAVIQEANRLRETSEKNKSEKDLLKDQTLQKMRAETFKLKLQVNELKEEVKKAKSGQKTQVSNQVEFNHLREQYERAVLQTEELKKSNRQLLDKLASKKPTTTVGSSANTADDLKHKLEISSRAVAASKKEAEALRSEVADLQLRESKYKLEATRAQQTLAHYKKKFGELK